ncbi:MAG TPA: class I SAM-dependent methyltransferase [Methylomirabilota bacterium]|nr:class I SAM-dependent methyltransferase [Methylomirabilota bacterium]
MKPSTALCGLGLLLLAGGCAPRAGQSALLVTAPRPAGDVPFLVTPLEVIDRMLGLARVGPDDVVYDLGSCDGRIVISAVKDFGARQAIGIEIDGTLVAKSRHYAQQAGVADRVSFVEQDFFRADFSDATVVTLYLTRDVNLKLRPKLLAELRPGTRVVSFNFDMGDWRPYAWIWVDADGRALPVYLWVVPPRR